MCRRRRGRLGSKWETVTELAGCQMTSVMPPSIIMCLDLTSITSFFTHYQTAQFAIIFPSHELPGKLRLVNTLRRAQR